MFQSEPVVQQRAGERWRRGAGRHEIVAQREQRETGKVDFTPVITRSNRKRALTVLCPCEQRSLALSDRGDERNLCYPLSVLM